MYNILRQILQLPKSLSYPFLERKSEKRELGAEIQNEQACRPAEPERSGDERESAVSDPRNLVLKSLHNQRPRMKASTDASVRGVNMQKRNVLRLCRLRVLRGLRGKKYRFFSAIPINASTAARPNSAKSLTLDSCILTPVFCVASKNYRARNILCRQ